MALEQQNPTLDKISAQLSFAGAGFLGPILSGLAGRFTLTFNESESLQSVRIYNEDGYNNYPAYTFDTDSGDAIVDIVFGTDTDTGASAKRNWFEWVTNFGTSRVQFWVKDLPTIGGIYCDGQEAQLSEAVLYVNHEAPIDPMEENASFSINILPTFNDEFFTQHEYLNNRYANTIRNWGGATTVEIDIDGSNVIPEMDIADLDGYYWVDPDYGLHSIRARLRAVTASPNYVDITGNIRIRQIPCP